MPAGLKVSSYGRAGSPRTYAAKLVDVNETGVGVEMFVPLVEGSRVSVEGELNSRDLFLSVRGRARVVHCRSGNNGMFRIGLAYEEVAYRKTA